MNQLPGNLSTFKILFIVQGILVLLFSLVFVVYAIFSFVIFNTIETQGEFSRQDVPFNPAKIFMTVGIIGFVITATIGSLTLVASKKIQQLKSYQFIFVVAILNVLTGLLGILLCIFTLIEISKPHVKGRFEGLEHYDEDEVLDPS